MVKLASRILPIAAAVTLLTACSTTEAEAPAAGDSSASVAPEETDVASAGPVTFPDCDRVAALIDGRLKGYALDKEESRTAPDQTDCTWYHSTNMTDGIAEGVTVSYSLQFESPADFPLQRDMAKEMHGADYVEDPLLDGRDAYMFKLDGGVTNTMAYVSPRFQINLVVVGGAVKTPPTAAEIVGLADLVKS